MDVAISVNGLRKRHGRQDVLGGVDIEAPAGAVYGLLGLNGSGKTTTIECLLGLLRPDGGRIAVLGSAPASLCRLGGRVAAVFDTPCLHPRLTVRQELEHTRLLLGGQGRAIEEVEERLGLGRHRQHRTSRLSLGTRRRLSIALALLGRPELVILDEPFSGLDAGGVEDLLKLIGDLNRRDGTSFFLSSHQLAYMERICSHAAFLHGGRVAVSGKVASLLAGGARLALRVDDVSRARQALAGAVRDEALREAGDGQLDLALDGADPAEVNRRLVLAGVGVSELRVERRGLEQLFHALTGGQS
jgi:ABC-2 type transport system ATP-binding protein